MDQGDMILEGPQTSSVIGFVLIGLYWLYGPSEFPSPLLLVRRCLRVLRGPLSYVVTVICIIYCFVTTHIQGIFSPMGQRHFSTFPEKHQTCQQHRFDRVWCRCGCPAYQRQHLTLAPVNSFSIQHQGITYKSHLVGMSGISQIMPVPGEHW